MENKVSSIQSIIFYILSHFQLIRVFKKVGIILHTVITLMYLKTTLVK
jgi:hypothetical protein